MDQATDYLLIQEAKLSKLTNSLKLILPNVQSSLLKVNVNAMKKIATRLPKKNIKDVERDAIRQIPGFKKDFFEAKTKLTRSKTFDSYTQRPAAVAVALVSSTTKYSVTDVIKTGEQRLSKIRLTSLIPGSGYLTLIKLGLFASFIAAIFVSDGAILIPAAQVVLRSMGLLFSLISNVLKGTAASLDSEKAMGDRVASWWEKQWQRPDADPTTTSNIQKMREPTPDYADSIMPHNVPSGSMPPVEDLSFIGKFLQNFDPLGIGGA